MMNLSFNHGKKHRVSSVPSVPSKERSDWAREKSLISHRNREVRRLLFFTFRILRFTNVSGREIIILIR